MFSFFEFPFIHRNRIFALVDRFLKGKDVETTRASQSLPLESKSIPSFFLADSRLPFNPSQPTRFPYFSLLPFRSSIFHDLVPKHVGLTTRKQNLRADNYREYWLA